MYKSTNHRRSAVAPSAYLSDSFKRMLGEILLRRASSATPLGLNFTYCTQYGTRYMASQGCLGRAGRLLGPPCQDFPEEYCLAKSLESRGSFDSLRENPPRRTPLIAIRCQQPDFFNFILQTTFHINHNPQRS